MRAVCLIFLFCLASLSSFAKSVAVIETWDRQLRIDAPNSLSVKEFLRIKVFEEDGYQHAVYSDYYNDFRKIKSLRYTIFDSNNRRVKKLTKMDAVDVMFNASYEIGDARTVILVPEYRNYPFTVEVEVEIEYNGFLDFPVWMPRYAPGIEVRKATLSLSCYKDFEFKSREFNGVNHPVVSNNAETKTFTWTIENLPAADKHVTYKSFAEEQAKVHIAPVNFTLAKTSGNFKSWTEFGEWYRKLNEGRNELSSETKKYLDSLNRHHKGDLVSLTKAVYKFMQRKTRYISIQLGIGGYQTIPSNEVESSGYGDCKALTNYMHAMLGYMNIRSNNVLVRAGSDVPDILADFPSNQFNHVFLAVPAGNDTLWFECTSQTSPPAHIGTFTDDRYVLWIEKDRSRIIRTPVYRENENIKASKFSVTLSAKGDAVLDVRINQTGFFFEEYMAYEGLPKDRIEQFNYAKFALKDFTIQSFNHQRPDKNKPVLDLEYKVKANGIGKVMGAKMIIQGNVFTPVEKEFDFEPLHRKADVRRGFTVADTFDIVLPENYRVLTVPASVDEVSDFGEMKLEIRVDQQNTIHINRKTVIYKGHYEKEQFDKFNDLIRKLRSFEKMNIVIQSKT